MESDVRFPLGLFEGKACQTRLAARAGDTTPRGLVTDAALSSAFRAVDWTALASDPDNPRRPQDPLLRGGYGMAVVFGITCCMTILVSPGLQTPTKQEPERPAGTSIPVSDESAAFDPRVEDRESSPTAEQLLQELKRKRPSGEPILPAGVREGGAWRRSHLLLPEGTAVVQRSGGLVWEDPWWIFSSERDDGEQRVKVLPNTNLEIMVRMAATVTTPARFTVSGEVTVFEDTNYLLVALATRARAQPVEMPEAPGTGLERETPAEHEQSAGPTTEAEQETAQHALANASAEDVLSLMRNQRTAQRTMLSEPAPPTAQARQSTLAAKTVLPEGTPIVNRPGRLVWQDGWWMFRFESDHPDHPELPLKVLPNQSLESMVNATRRGPTGLVFLISGEVTAFESDNYLLTRTAMRRIDAGNLTR